MTSQDKFLLLSTPLCCPSRSLIGKGRSLTTTNPRILRSSSLHPSQVVQLQVIAHSWRIFTLPSLFVEGSLLMEAYCNLWPPVFASRHRLNRNRALSYSVSVCCCCVKLFLLKLEGFAFMLLFSPGNTCVLLFPSSGQCKQGMACRKTNQSSRSSPFLCFNIFYSLLQAVHQSSFILSWGRSWLRRKNEILAPSAWFSKRIWMMATTCSSSAQ